MHVLQECQARDSKSAAGEIDFHTLASGGATAERRSVFGGSSNPRPVPGAFRRALRGIVQFQTCKECIEPHLPVVLPNVILM